MRARERRAFVEKIRSETRREEALLTGSFISGIFADLGLVGTGEEIMRLYRAGNPNDANVLAVTAIERKFERPGEQSDVFIYFGRREGSDAQYHCCNCLLAGGASDFAASSVVEMIEHLKKHEIAGHAVPKLAAARLRSSALREAIAVHDAAKRGGT